MGEADSYKYKQMVINAFQTWQTQLSGMVVFNIVQNLHDSHINVEWKRVERKSLGNCQFNYDKLGRYYSAEVNIGLSDGIIHRKYMDENEVYHTILHEVGHAIGLGHSPNIEDIMYTPHQYGRINLSRNDIQTARFLYKFAAKLKNIVAIGLIDTFLTCVLFIRDIFSVSLTNGLVCIWLWFLIFFMCNSYRFISIMVNLLVVEKEEFVQKAANDVDAEEKKRLDNAIRKI